MSSSLITFIGPFISITKKNIMGYVIHELKSCPGHPSKEFSEENFCPICGVKLISKKISRLSPINADDVIDWEDDELMVPMYLSNVILPVNREFPSKIEDTLKNFGFIELSEKEDEKTLQISWFKKHHASGIKKLIDAFGEDNVMICWGVVQYYG